VRRAGRVNSTEGTSLEFNKRKQREQRPERVEFVIAGADRRSSLVGMKPEAPNRLSRAFSLIELLVVVAIVVVVSNLYLVRVNKPDRRATVAGCLNNLKNISVEQQVWLQENDGKFPWEIPVSEGGTKELIGSGNASPHFQGFTRYITNASVFLCPSDSTRMQATSVSTLTDSNLSYFINLDVVTNSTTGILAGGRHLQVNGQPVPPGLNTITTNSQIGWTRELHNNPKTPPRGNMVFADGHVELVSGDLTERFVQQGKAESRLVVP
jgi:prepilin-type N-terminal cleavage/methylation domain-containing protein/prepilin-type processing-associated H-X9-DG protein